MDIRSDIFHSRRGKINSSARLTQASAGPLTGVKRFDRQDYSAHEDFIGFICNDDLGSPMQGRGWKLLFKQTTDAC